MSGKKIKIALCLSGEPRSSMFCFPYIYESFINLGPRYEVNVFIHTRKNFRAFNLYNPSYFMVDDIINIPLINYVNLLKLPSKLDQERKHYSSHTHMVNNITHQLLMVDGIYKSFLLSKEENKIFDIYIRCRPDIFTDSLIDIGHIVKDILNKKYDIFIPSKNLHKNTTDFNNSKKEYNDQFAIGNYKSIESYSNMVNNLEYLINKTNSFKVEKWLIPQLDQSNIKVNQSYFPLNLIRKLQINSNRGYFGENDIKFLDQ